MQKRDSHVPTEVGKTQGLEWYLMRPRLASNSGRKHLGGGGRNMGLRDRTLPCLLPWSSPSKNLSPKLDLVCLLTSGRHVLPSQGLLPRSICLSLQGKQTTFPRLSRKRGLDRDLAIPRVVMSPWVSWVSRPPVLGWRCSCLSNCTPPPLLPLWRIL